MLRVVPINERGELDLEAYRTAAVGAHQDRGARARLERAGHDQSGRGDDRAGARARRRRAGRRRAGGAAHAVDVQALDCDFFVLLEPQDVRADRHRRALRQAGRCSRRCRRSRAAAT